MTHGTWDSSLGDKSLDVGSKDKGGQLPDCGPLVCGLGDKVRRTETTGPGRDPAVP